MQSAFWSNTIWYILLAVTSIISLVLILYKSNNRKFIIGFSLSVLGVTFFAETCLLTLSNAYRYFPKISSDPFLDSIIGNYFSQFSITTTAVLTTVFKLTTIWNFIFAATYYFIEESFLKIGIYQHIWYKSWFTFIAVLLMLWVVKRWYYYLRGYSPKYIYYLSLFAGASALFSITIVFFIYAFSIQVININFNLEFFRDQAILIVSYRSILIAIMIILYWLKLKWMLNGVSFAFLFMFQYVLTQIDLITIKDGLFSIVTLVNLFGAYFSVVSVDYLLSKGTANNQ